jgi:sensitive to high expression protein 9
VSLFTSLVRQDHENEQAEIRAKQRSASADSRLEIQFNELMRALLNRYHEEQIWSDKIRSASTYGSLGALALNLVVFVLAIVVVEPWKRKRLGETFEQRMIVLERENQSLMQDSMQKLEEHFEKQEQIMSRLAAAATDTPVDHTSPSQAPVDDSPREASNPPPVQSLCNARAISALAGAIGGMMVMCIVRW